MLKSNYCRFDGETIVSEDGIDWYHLPTYDGDNFHTPKPLLTLALLSIPISQAVSVLPQLIDEGLAETAAEVGKWLACLAFEANPFLRVNDKGQRYMAKPLCLSRGK